MKERRVLCLNIVDEVHSVFCRPRGDLLFRVLRRSTIGAGVIYGRVRDGIGYGRPAKATRPAKDRIGAQILARVVAPIISFSFSLDYR
jgi:hypothetical protein